MSKRPSTGCPGLPPSPSEKPSLYAGQRNRLAAVKDIHCLYCQLTGQQLTLRYDRERLWFEFLRAGFAPQELRRVVRYLQKEIRAGRRNVGALKLSNLLQLDRFEEDLNIAGSDSTPRPPPWLEALAHSAIPLRRLLPIRKLCAKRP